MSIRYTIRFRAKIAPGGPETDEAAAGFIVDEDLCFYGEVDADDYMGIEPSFGEEIAYRGRSFADLTGVRVVDGVLEIGVSSTNLAWPHHDEIDGVQPRPDFTRQDAILVALSKATTGVEGEVHGVIGVEHLPEPAGWPLIRCDDGIIRIAQTPCGWDHGDHDGYRRPSPPPAEVGGVLPAGFAKARFSRGMEIDVDLERLKRQLAGFDLTRSQAQITEASRMRPVGEEPKWK